MLFAGLMLSTRQLRGTSATSLIVWQTVGALIFGAVLSSFNSCLNSASALYTCDLHKKYVNPDAQPRRTGQWVAVGPCGCEGLDYHGRPPRAPRCPPHHPVAVLPVFRLLKRLFLLGLLLTVAAGGGVLWWLERPLPLSSEAPLLVEVPPGSSARSVAQRLSRAGVQLPAPLLEVWFRLSGQAQDIKAGTYEVPEGTTPRTLLQRLVSGEQELMLGVVTAMIGAPFFLLLVLRQRLGAAC